MPIQQFTLKNLDELDGGKAAVAFENHVRRAALDCTDRPGDKAARKVVLEVLLVPVMEQGGDCVSVDAQIKVSSAVPKHQTKPYSFGLRRGGMLVFNPDSVDNINQTTLIDGEDE